MPSRDDNAASARPPVRKREAAGAGMREGYLERLSAAMGRRVEAYDLLDLLTTDTLAGDFADKINECGEGDMPCHRRTWPAAQLQRLSDGLAAVADTDPERPVILFAHNSDYCGAAVLPLAEVLAKALPLLQAGGGRLAVGTKDMSDGLLLRLADAESSGAPQAYELTVWGDNWLPAMGG